MQNSLSNEKEKSINAKEDFKQNTEKNLSDFLKKEKVQDLTDARLRKAKTDIENVKSNQPPIKNLDIDNYADLRKKFLKLEYHNFDYDWYPNVNKYDNTQLTNFQELSFVPGKLEHTLQKKQAESKESKVENEADAKLPIKQ